MMNLQLRGREYEVDAKLHAYVERKLASLDRYFPHAHQPQGIAVEIFRDPNGKEDNRYRVSAIIKVKGKDIKAETATINPHSAIDIVEEKLKGQIRKYKDRHAPSRLRGIKDRLLRRAEY